MTDEQFTDALLHFRSCQPSPLHQPDAAHLRDLVEEFRRSFGAAWFDADLVGRLRRAIVEGLQRLDAVPRDDPFWRGSNLRPTEGKVYEYARLVLHDQPDAEWALWVLAANNLRYCSNDFGLTVWERLETLGKLDVAWPISAALHVRAQTSLNSTDTLIGFLKRIGRCARTRTALERFLYSADDGQAIWARRLRDACRVPRRREWLEWQDGMARKIAGSIRVERRFEDLPILADALEEAGCSDADLLAHCRNPGPHQRGCWVVDWLVGAE